MLPNRITTICLAMVVLLASTSRATALPIVVDFENAVPQELAVLPYIEDGVLFTVLSGHYDIFLGIAGSTLFTIDDHTGLPLIAITLQNGRPFDLVGFDIIGFTEFNFVTSNLGDLFVPTSNGTVTFSGTFTGITALFLRQHPVPDPDEAVQQHNFTIDNLTVIPTPEPSSFALVMMAIGGLLLIRRRST